MGATLDIFATAPLGIALLGWTALGPMWVGLSVLAFVRSRRRVARNALELERIALDGEPQRARIRAREAPLSLAPLLATLSGEPRPDLGGRSRASAWATTAVIAPPGVVALVAFSAPDPRTFLAAGVALGVLLPIGLLAGRTVFLVDRATDRTIRRACVALLEANARADVERKRSAHLLRRGGEVEPG